MYTDLYVYLCVLRVVCVNSYIISNVTIRYHNRNKTYKVITIVLWHL